MVGGTAKTRGRAIFALAAVAAVASLGSAATGAGDAGAGAPGQIRVVDGSWYWAAQVPAVPPVAGQNLGQPAAVPSPDVPSGDFPVSARAGQSEKESYLHIDASAVPSGATVQRFVLSLSEDAGAKSPTPGDAKLQAVPVVDFWTGGEAARPFDERPKVDAKLVVPGKRAADGTWTFDLTPIAAKWADGSLGNNGIALQPVVDPGATFQVVWSGTSPPPVVEGLVVPLPSTAPAAAAPAAAPGPEAVTPVPVDAAPVNLQPDFATPVVAPSAPRATVPARTARATTASGALRRAAASHRSPTAGFWLAGLAVFALVAAAAVALGERGDPREARRGSVLRALERRALDQPEEAR